MFDEKPSVFIFFIDSILARLIVDKPSEHLIQKCMSGTIYEQVENQSTTLAPLQFHHICQIP